MVDKYLNRSWDPRFYNCWHLVREFWLELTGQDVQDLTPPAVNADSLKAAFETHTPKFREIKELWDPCIIKMEGIGTPHVGVYYKGKILHITRNGVQYQPLSVAVLGFKKVSYYLCNV